MQAFIFLGVKDIGFLLQGVQMLLPGGYWVFTVQTYRMENGLPQLIHAFFSR
ncbi:hypothetical protein D3C80_2048520 [compost metagenome]